MAVFNGFRRTKNVRTVIGNPPTAIPVAKLTLKTFSEFLTANNIVGEDGKAPSTKESFRDGMFNYSRKESKFGKSFTSECGPRTIRNIYGLPVINLNEEHYTDDLRRIVREEGITPKIARIIVRRMLGTYLYGSYNSISTRSVPGGLLGYYGAIDTNSNLASLGTVTCAILQQYNEKRNKQGEKGVKINNLQKIGIKSSELSIEVVDCWQAVELSTLEDFFVGFELPPDGEGKKLVMIPAKSKLPDGVELLKSWKVPVREVETEGTWRKHSVKYINVVSTPSEIAKVSKGKHISNNAPRSDYIMTTNTSIYPAELKELFLGQFIEGVLKPMTLDQTNYKTKVGKDVKSANVDVEGAFQGIFRTMRNAKTMLSKSGKGRVSWGTGGLSQAIGYKISLPRSKGAGGTGTSTGTELYRSLVRQANLLENVKDVVLRDSYLHDITSNAGQLAGKIRGATGASAADTLITIANNPASLTPELFQRDSVFGRLGLLCEIVDSALTRRSYKAGLTHCEMVRSLIIEQNESEGQVTDRIILLRETIEDAYADFYTTDQVRWKNPFEKSLQNLEVLIAAKLSSVTKNNCLDLHPNNLSGMMNNWNRAATPPDHSSILSGSKVCLVKQEPSCVKIVRIPQLGMNNRTKTASVLAIVPSEIGVKGGMMNPVRTIKESTTGSINQLLSNVDDLLWIKKGIYTTYGGKLTVGREGKVINPNLVGIQALGDVSSGELVIEGVKIDFDLLQELDDLRENASGLVPEPELCKYGGHSVDAAVELVGKINNVDQLYEFLNFNPVMPPSYARVDQDGEPIIEKSENSRFLTYNEYKSFPLFEEVVSVNELLKKVILDKMFNENEDDTEMDTTTTKDKYKDLKRKSTSGSDIVIKYRIGSEERAYKPGKGRMPLSEVYVDANQPRSPLAPPPNFASFVSEDHSTI